MKDDSHFHDSDPDELEKIEDELFDYQSEIDAIESEEKAYREERARKLKARHEKGIVSDFEKYEEKMKAQAENEKTQKKVSDQKAVQEQDLPEIKAEEPEIRAEEPEAKAEEPEPEVKAEELEVKTEEPEVKTEEPEAKAEEPEIRANEPEPEIKTEEPEVKAEEPEIKAEEPQDFYISEDEFEAAQDSQVSDEIGGTVTKLMEGNADRTETGRKDLSLTKEQQEEIDFLGETFDGSSENVDRPVPVKKKHPARIAIVLVIVIAALGALFYKYRSDQKLETAFSQKVDDFRTEKIDGAELGIHEQYFTDFLSQCDQAISDQDISAINDLNSQWDDVEAEYDTVMQGKSDLDTFADTVQTALDKYIISDEYKDQCDALTSSIAAAQSDVDYDQLTDLQNTFDDLSTNLKSSSLAAIDTLKNDISVIEIDTSQLTDEQKQKIQDYSDQADQETADEDYAAASDTLSAWKDYVSGISQQQESAAESERARLESESAAVESIQAQQAQIQTNQTEAETSSNEDATTGEDTTADYIFPDSSSRYLTDEDLNGLSSYQLMIARNEIYARHGWIFQNEELAAYFSTKSWYHGTVLPKDFSPSVLNKYETANINLILSHEN